MHNKAHPEIEVNVTDLSCRRGERMLFGDVSFALKSGELLQLRGPNGSGKSSLLTLLCGFWMPETGTIEVREDGEEPEATLRDYAHYLGHRNALKPSLSVMENLTFWHRFGATPGLQPVEALKTIGLGALAPLPAGVLSAGQKRRVAFARLLVEQRPIWLLDEPTAALDAASDTLIGRLVSDHVARGGIAIAATHLPLQLTLAEDAITTLDLSRYAPRRRQETGADA